ncbi:MAG: tryptophan-rich sensory protein [Proteobacteria bacterium]|nr:tryptophan-rich sensory protein [Pseudomonadota bacterium]
MALRAGHGRTLLAAAGAAALVACLGALITRLDPWYYALALPSWKPPDWLFGPAWTLIFGLAALSGYLSWTHAGRDRAFQARLLALFTINGLLNIAWSALFFRFHRPDWALLEVALLWVSILGLIVLSSRKSSAAAWLLVPYLAWVSFAAALNGSVVRLNNFG